MLLDLHIKDVVTIETLALTCSGGFAALTGETGAGKSILLDALGLALGQRGESRLIRKGAETAAVTASFDVTDKRRVAQLRDLLTEQDVAFENPMVLRRTLQLDAQGQTKSRAFFNDQPVSLTLLKNIGDLLVEIHGQFETQNLLDTKTHRALVDRFGGLDALLHDVAVAWEVWQMAAQHLAQLQQDLATAARERGHLEATIDELRQLNPSADEEESLAVARSMMMHAEKILQAINEATSFLQADQGARSAVHSALRSMERVADKLGDTVTPILNGLNVAAIEIDEAAAALETLGDRMVFDRDAQGKTDERLFALRAAARKYQVTVPELPAILQRSENLLQQLQDQDTSLYAAMAAVTKAEAAFTVVAKKLSAARQKAAAQLAKAVMTELPPLKLDKAQFVIEQTEKPPSADGVDHIVFAVAMNPGLPPGPLHKVASGGEMARLMLAIKLVTQASDATPTLIFDEIDTGVAGAVAEAIGLRLRRLGDAAQVLAVTHAPQVAAKAHAHYKIAKQSDKKTTRTDVKLLDHDARITEIARLLSGATITAAARDTAAQLLTVDAAPVKNTKKKVNR